MQLRPTFLKTVLAFRMQAAMASSCKYASSATVADSPPSCRTPQGPCDGRHARRGNHGDSYHFHRARGAAQFSPSMPKSGGQQLIADTSRACRHGTDRTKNNGSMCPHGAFHVSLECIQMPSLVPGPDINALAWDWQWQSTVRMKTIYLVHTLGSPMYQLAPTNVISPVTEELIKAVSCPCGTLQVPF